MARVVLIGNLAQLTGGAAEFRISATSVKHLFQQLAELHPAIGPHLEEGVAVAIDGQIYQDALFQPIAPESEVFILPQIAGGAGRVAALDRLRPKRADGARRVVTGAATSSEPAACVPRGSGTYERGR